MWLVYASVLRPDPIGARGLFPSNGQPETCDGNLRGLTPAGLVSFCDVSSRRSTVGLRIN